MLQVRVTSMPVHPVVKLCWIARLLDRFSARLPMLVANDYAHRYLIELENLRDGEPVIPVHEPEFTISGDMYGNIGTRTIKGAVQKY